MFSRSGTTWVQEEYVKASNTGPGDAFGAALSLSADGTRLAVAAWLEGSSAAGIDHYQADDPAGAGSGAVYIYETDLTARRPR